MLLCAKKCPSPSFGKMTWPIPLCYGPTICHLQTRLLQLTLPWSNSKFPQKLQQAAAQFWSTANQHEYHTSALHSALTTNWTHIHFEVLEFFLKALKGFGSCWFRKCLWLCSPISLLTQQRNFIWQSQDINLWLTGTRWSRWKALNYGTNFCSKLDVIKMTHRSTGKRLPISWSQPQDSSGLQKAVPISHDRASVKLFTSSSARNLFVLFWWYLL